MKSKYSSNISYLVYELRYAISVKCILHLETLIQKKDVKYLIISCWSYVETIF